MMRWVAIFVLLIAGVICIEMRNTVLALQMKIPQIERELKKVERNNRQLRYSIERFQSPDHLIELARQPEFSHLKPAYQTQVIHIHD